MCLRIEAGTPDFSTFPSQHGDRILTLPVRSQPAHEVRTLVRPHQPPAVSGKTIESVPRTRQDTYLRRVDNGVGEVIDGGAGNDTFRFVRGEANTQGLFNSMLIPLSPVQLRDPDWR